MISGCKQKANSSISPIIENPQSRIDSCWSKKDKQMILTAIIGSKDFQYYLHPENETRLPILLSSNDFVTKDLEIFSNGQKVVITDYNPDPESRTHKITMNSLNCEKELLSYSVFYPIEGAVIEGTVKKISDRWVATVSHVGEKN
jgi:hypothetical protein